MINGQISKMWNKNGRFEWFSKIKFQIFFIRKFWLKRYNSGYNSDYFVLTLFWSRANYSHSYYNARDWSRLKLSKIAKVANFVLKIEMVMPNWSALEQLKNMTPFLIRSFASFATGNFARCHLQCLNLHVTWRNESLFSQKT